MQAKGWASRVHQRVWEVPDLPCGEGAMRAARIGRGFSALFALLIWAMRSVQGTEHWVARASGALRLAARAMGVDTVREVRRGGCGGQLGGQQGRERENREGERARRLSRGGQWACRARTGCARDALQGGASRTGMRAQGIARGGSARRGHRGEGRPTILLPHCGGHTRILYHYRYARREVPVAVIPYKSGSVFIPPLSTAMIIVALA